MKCAFLPIVTLIAVLGAVGIAHAGEQVSSSATSTVIEPGSLGETGDGVLDSGGGSKKAGAGGRTEALRCFQRGVRILDEPVSPAPTETLARGATIQARTSDGRRLAVYAVGSGLCVLTSEVAR